MTDESRMVNIALSKKLLERIDTFRFENRFPTRAEAMRWLMDWALEKDPSVQFTEEITVTSPKGGKAKKKIKTAATRYDKRA